MPKILIVDTYYPEFLKSWDFNPAATYERELRRLLEFSFGTGDFYSRNLRALGWEAFDCIANSGFLNSLPHGELPHDIDVLFSQDLSLPIAKGKARLLAAQCSCPWPGDDKVRQFDVIFTSFPHYIPRIEALGVKAVYNPLAFDPIVLDRLYATAPYNTILHQEPSLPTYRGSGFHEVPMGVFTHWGPTRNPKRVHDVVFIGGVGAPSHWRRGMETLNAVAEAIPTFKWWGYGAELLAQSSALFKAYQGEAWGLDMYRILLQSKIVLNRHGEVAEGYANNMRMFEATGCGAMLVTEDAPNIEDFFDGGEAQMYTGSESAIRIINYFLADDAKRADIARHGQARTLRDHTYQTRMQCVSDTLKAML